MHPCTQGAVADNQFQQAAEVAHEDDESEEQHAKQRVGAHFLQNVAGENAHKLLV